MGALPGRPREDHRPVALTHVLRLFILPPGSLILLLVYGLVKRKRWPCITAVALLYLLSLPPVAYLLLRSLEVPSGSLEGAQAIVVLGAGSVASAPEYGGGPDVTSASLARVRYGRTLQEQTGLPMLLSGGDHEAETMARAYPGEGEVWLEDQSTDTHENAELSAPILRSHGVKTIILVTHAFHMRRARRAFERLGLEVRPAATGRSSWGRWSGGIFLVLPSADALYASSSALEEWLGILYYRIRW